MYNFGLKNCAGHKGTPVHDKTDYDTMKSFCLPSLSPLIASEILHHPVHLPLL